MEQALHPKIKKIVDEVFLKVFKSTTGSSELAPITDIFLNHWFNSEIWVTYDEEVLNMELESLNLPENQGIENAIPESKFRLFQKEPESNTWKSLITGIGGYEIDTKKYSLIKVDFLNEKRAKN